jgi:hypothetical protein
MPHGNIVGVDLLMIQVMVATVTDQAVLRWPITVGRRPER